MSSFRTVHFRLRDRLIAFVSTRLCSNITYTVRNGLATGMRRRGGLGFLPLPISETAETRFLASLDFAEKTVYDVGAFEGVMTLFFARKAREVITYEPNPKNYRRCVDNVKLNNLENVRVFNRGLSSEAGHLELTYDPLMPGAGSGNHEVSRQIAASVASATRVQIEVASLDAEIETLKLPPPDFIKIDIEGMELRALRGMSHTLTVHGPELFIELHGAELSDKISNTVAVIELLERLDYRIYGVENRTLLDSTTVGPHPPNHLYCTLQLVS